ncbi:MAG: hydrogenase expression/formation protein [Chloroflexi bacterium]|nr:hydrogenase expression/formation protein [Chloroflexota bacterium]
MSQEITILKNGKLPGHLLQELIDGLPKGFVDERLLIGPGLGEDAAHILFGESTLLAKTDPITFATDRIGWYAVNVNANDIAVAGGTPKWFLATLMMPPGSTESEIRGIFAQISEAAQEIDVQLAGGHTEITPAVTQPVICGFMLGEAPTGHTVSASGAKPGDSVILTKGIAIEGTSILANECRDALVQAGVPSSDINAAAEMLTNPGISVLEDAQTAVSAGEITAMHDPTEGGLATALQELAFASNVEIVIDKSAVNVLPLCQSICDALGIDPWGLISSGALLATVQSEYADAVVDALRDAGIDTGVIGRVESHADGKKGSSVYVRRNRTSSLIAITTFERDELARYFESDL